MSWAYNKVQISYDQVLGLGMRPTCRQGWSRALKSKAVNCVLRRVTIENTSSWIGHKSLRKYVLYNFFNINFYFNYLDLSNLSVYGNLYIILRLKIKENQL